MARKCIDIAENRKITSVSPIAMFMWVGIYVILSAIMDFGLLYLICVFLSYVLCIILFQYSPRFVFMSIRYLGTNSYLTPSFEDEQYIVDEERIKNITTILRKGSQ
jgi:hypothetical protein